MATRDKGPLVESRWLTSPGIDGRTCRLHEEVAYDRKEGTSELVREDSMTRQVHEEPRVLASNDKSDLVCQQPRNERQESRPREEQVQRAALATSGCAGP